MGAWQRATLSSKCIADNLVKRTHPRPQVPIELVPGRRRFRPAARGLCRTGLTPDYRHNGLSRSMDAF